MASPILLALLVPLLAFAPSTAAHVEPAAHYVPHVDDSFTFHEVLAVAGGYGNYTGYSETEDVNGTLTVTAVAANGTVSASYDYAQHYWNSTGFGISWTSSGTFTFSDKTYHYLHGTDNQTGDNGTATWFYMNNSLTTGDAISSLGTPLTIRGTSADFALGTSAGSYVSAIRANGSGAYERNDVYGQFDAAWQYTAYYDPSTGYIVGYEYLEHDTNPQGDGFLYTDELRVTHTSYTLTAGATPKTYSLTVDESGLGSTTPWTVLVNGTPTTGTGTSIVVTGLPNGTYLVAAAARGYSSSPVSWTVTIAGGDQVVSASWSSPSSGPAAVNPIVVFVVLAVVLALIVAVIAIVVSRRAHRSLPQHSAGGMPQYGGPLAGTTPPPISLTPGDQPRIQQVVVKEVVKVKCSYCGSLIDSTAPTCPFCGATRT